MLLCCLQLLRCLHFKVDSVIQTPQLAGFSTYRYQQAQKWLSVFCFHTRRSPCLSSLGKYQLQAGMASQECVHFNLLTPSFIFLKLHHCGIKMFEQKAKTEHKDVVLVVLLYKPFLVPSTNNLLLFADLETGKASPKQNGSKWHIQPLLYMQIS